MYGDSCSGDSGGLASIWSRISCSRFAESMTDEYEKTLRVLLAPLAALLRVPVGLALQVLELLLHGCDQLDERTVLWVVVLVPQVGHVEPLERVVRGALARAEALAARPAAGVVHGVCVVLLQRGVSVGKATAVERLALLHADYTCVHVRLCRMLA
eukprot:2682344-Prymnesium_polylepis.1